MSLQVTVLLRGILVIGLLVCLTVQVLAAGGLLFGDGTAPLTAKVVLAVAAVLGLACVEVAIVSVWRLVSLVRQNTVFSPAAFRWVDAIIGAIVGAAFFVLLAGYVVAEVDDAPGLILVTAVLSLLIAGVALIVYVQRMLLVQATGFSAELEAVI
ncbi:DUF2975 domain-containing protein [Corynebacterium comes]|uniref:DUF2975 domain-containing protein n=1 Tax=Corynebacterium comes TaxID=2675218 RepID=A0A6B8W3N4_9CORY|nr:DUF2975 domain-containing protein [Corynebacterium comes]QGU04440.1 hypothetical protein CETAM_05850 [Corynebacterium comes]